MIHNLITLYNALELGIRNGLPADIGHEVYELQLLIKDNLSSLGCIFDEEDNIIDIPTEDY